MLVVLTILLQSIALSTQHLLRGRDYSSSAFEVSAAGTSVITIHARVVGFDKGLFHFPVLDYQSISLAPWLTKYGCCIKGKIQSIC